MKINDTKPPINNLRKKQTVQNISLNPTNDVSEEMIEKIRKELIEKTYYSDIKYNIGSKSRWKCAGDVSETLAHIIIAMGIILAFATGFFNVNFLAFISGSMSTGALVFLRFSSYAMKESKERTYQVNRLIEKLGFDDIPDITIDSAGSDIATNISINDI